MMPRIVIAGLFLGMLPIAAHADVRINEIAWMGTIENANAEWIELYNSGEETSLAGWTVLSSSGTPSITLTGTIPADGFYLLTRTSVNNVPGVTGDQAYTGALSNSGATLSLIDAGGVEQDTVVGGTNWKEIGGDNTTKKTPQRGESGWVTATPTPKAPNAEIAGEDTEEPEEEVETPATTTPQVTIGGSSTSSASPSYTTPKLYIVTGPSRIVSAHATTPFIAYVYDETKRLSKNAQVSWNFGDGAIETGAAAEHAYFAPGTYLVVVRASNAYTSVIKTIIVEVEDAAVTIGTVSADGVELFNESDHMTDLSGWQIKAGSKRFKIPSDTALLPRGHVILPAVTTKLDTDNASVSLLYPGGEIAHTVHPSTLELLSERELH